MAGYSTRTEHILRRLERMKTERQPWHPLYGFVGNYVATLKQHFDSTPIPGEMLNEQVFDDTAPNANKMMAATMIGALWPNGAKTFQIAPPLALQSIAVENQDVKDYYSFVTQTMVGVFDHPRSGFLTSLEEYMTEQGAFGLSGIGAFEEDDTEVPILFKAVDAKKLYIDEGRNGFVDTIYTLEEMTIRQLIQEYGYENVCKKSRDAFDSGKGDDKVQVLHAIEPRMERDPFGIGVKDYPFASIHIELEPKKILRESGYAELPVFVTRFWKAMGEKRGRSPAMNAMPSILEINLLREAVIVATEKTVNPPINVHDDGSFGNGTIDTSAGAINVISVSGRIANTGVKPIEPMNLVGDLSPVYARITELTEAIRNHFFMDRLTDLNNEKQMTLGEAQIRNELRGQSLNTVYARQIAEEFTPLLERVFSSLLRRGYLGVEQGSELEAELLLQGRTPRYIPPEVSKLIRSGQDVYRIIFVSPAARVMQSEELLGIQRTLEFGAGLAQLNPEALDNLDMDAMVRRVAELTGAPREVIQATQAVQEIRKQRQQMQQAAMQQQQGQMESEQLRNVAQAANMVGGQQ